MHSGKENEKRKDTVVLCSTAESSDFTPDQTWLFSQVKIMNHVWLLFWWKSEEGIEILASKKWGVG
jgi:hypothetical protein